MIPSAWVSVVLVLATYRVLRLVGWDDFPPVEKARAWITGEHWVPDEPPPDIEAPREDRPPPEEPAGKVPDPVRGVRAEYRRPLLAHFLHCPFCVGFWISCAVYVAWLEIPTATLYALAPFALSGAVGLIAKNLDG